MVEFVKLSAVLTVLGGVGYAAIWVLVRMRERIVRRRCLREIEDIENIDPYGPQNHPLK